MKMNKISLVAAAAVMAMGSLSAQAADVAVNVSVGLTAKCEVDSVPANLAFVYDAFQAGPATAGGSVKFKCTRGRAGAPTATLDSAPSVVGGLQYALTVGSGLKGDGTAENGSGNGTPDTYTYSLSGTMAGGQAGDATADANQVRTLTVAY